MKQLIIYHEYGVGEFKYAFSDEDLSRFHNCYIDDMDEEIEQELSDFLDADKKKALPALRWVEYDELDLSMLPDAVLIGRII